MERLEHRDDPRGPAERSAPRGRQHQRVEVPGAVGAGDEIPLERAHAQEIPAARVVDDDDLAPVDEVPAHQRVLGEAGAVGQRRAQGAPASRVIATRRAPAQRSSIAG
jgi:hypothetical protein